MRTAYGRGLDVRFRVADALFFKGLGRTFAGVIDCGLSHTFGDEERLRYVAGLATVVRLGGTYHVLCFSDREPLSEGPRRVTQQEILDAFRDGWQVEQIREARFETVDGPAQPQFSPGGPMAWLATVARTAG